MEKKGVEYHQQIKEHLSAAYLLSDERIEAVLPRFLETIRTLMSKLEDFAGTDENDALSRTGHAIKGALLNLGLHDLAERAFLIEKHQHIGNIDRTPVQLVNELKKEIEKLL